MIDNMPSFSIDSSGSNIDSKWQSIERSSHISEMNSFVLETIVAKYNFTKATSAKYVRRIFILSSYKYKRKVATTALSVTDNQYIRNETI